MRGIFDGTSESRVQSAAQSAARMPGREGAERNGCGRHSGERKIKLTLLLAAAHPLVHVNASLNSLATVLLLLGLFFIKRGRVEAHKRTMLAAFVVSIAFLVCYVVVSLFRSAVSSSRIRAGSLRLLRHLAFARFAGDHGSVSWRSGKSTWAFARSVAAAASCRSPSERAIAAAYRDKHCRWPRGHFQSGSMFPSRAWWFM